MPDPPRTPPSRFSETYADILARNSLEELTADGASVPPAQHDLGMALTGAFGAKFVEVQVDTDLGRPVEFPALPRRSSTRWWCPSKGPEST
nr:hypothetical protein JVH1_0733 [Rhodococcus sp. JVH1]